MTRKLLKLDILDDKNMLDETPLHIRAKIYQLLEQHEFHSPESFINEVFSLYGIWKFKNQDADSKDSLRYAYFKKINSLTNELSAVLSNTDIRMKRVLETKFMLTENKFDISQMLTDLNMLSKSTNALLQTSNNSPRKNTSLKETREFIIKQLYKAFTLGTGKTQKYTCNQITGVKAEVYSGDFFYFLKGFYKIIGLGYKTDAAIAKDINRLL